MWNSNKKHPLFRYCCTHGMEQSPFCLLHVHLWEFYLYWDWERAEWRFCARTGLDRGGWARGGRWCEGGRCGGGWPDERAKGAGMRERMQCVCIYEIEELYQNENRGEKNTKCSRRRNGAHFWGWKREQRQGKGPEGCVLYIWELCTLHGRIQGKAVRRRIDRLSRRSPIALRYEIIS